MSANRHQTRSAAAKSSSRRQKKELPLRKGQRVHPATQKKIRKLRKVNAASNSQGSQREKRVGNKESTERNRQSRKLARERGIMPQRQAMKRASEHHRLQQAVAPGSRKALRKLQNSRGVHKLHSIRSFLKQKPFAERIWAIENCRCWFLPHGKRECHSIPQGFIIKVECKRRQSNVLARSSEAWVTLYRAGQTVGKKDAAKVRYCVDARNVFVTEASLLRRRLIGEEARTKPQKARLERKKNSQRLLKTRR